MGSSIIDYRLERQNELVLILNVFDDAIGVGRTRFNSNMINWDQITVTNLLDIGMYLRDEEVGIRQKAHIRPKN